MATIKKNGYVDGVKCRQTVRESSMVASHPMNL